MNHDEPLSLHEQLVLLMLRDDTGTMESHTAMYQLALGGSLLAQLLLAGAVRIDTEDKNRVKLARAKRLGDPILDECLEMVSQAKRPLPAADWASRFGGLRRLRHRIAEELCRKGILEDSEDKVLFFFTRSVYPTINPEPERRLVEALRSAVLGDSSELRPDIALLVALAHATGLIRIHFDKREIKNRKERIEKIAKGDLIGSATVDAVRAAEAAVQAAQAAIMAAIIASTVVTSTTH